MSPLEIGKVKHKPKSPLENVDRVSVKKTKLQKAYDNEIPRCCSSYRQCGLDQSATHLNISTAHSSVITDDMMNADTGTTEAESILIPVVLVCSCLLLLTLAS